VSTSHEDLGEGEHGIQVKVKATASAPISGSSASAAALGSRRGFGAFGVFIVSRHVEGVIVLGDLHSIES